MAQQATTFTVYGGTQPAMLQTVQPRVIPVPVRSETVPHRRSHRILGMIQMALGLICFVLSVSGFFVSHPTYHYFGPGIYSGIFFVLAGLLGFLAAKQNSKCLIVGCMVMNIIASCVAVIGLSFASIEIASNNRLFEYYGVARYPYVRCIIVLFICILELIITIVHAGFTCASCCDCCLPRQAMTVTQVTTSPVVIQQGSQGGIVYPVQAYPGFLPQQQLGQQIMVQQPYPQPPPGQISSQPQGATAQPPAYDVAFSHETPDVKPPSYSQITLKD